MRYFVKVNGRDHQVEVVERLGELAVSVDGKEIDGLYPAKWAYRRHEQEPTTEVAIRRTPSEDLYAVLGGFDLADQSVTLQLVVNPLVNWIWFGFGIMALGTGIALLPERSFAFAVAKMPGEAAATTVAILLLVLLSGGTLFAQGSLSARCSTLAGLGKGTRAYLGNADASRMGLVKGDHVELAGPAGTLRLPFELDDSVPAGAVFVPYALAGGGIGKLGAPTGAGLRVKISKVAATATVGA